MLHQQPTYEEMKAALKEAAKVPPLEGFRNMVRRGLIDSEGRLTKLYGGEAELDPEAVKYLKSQKAKKNGDRP